ncbi:hypothetical protein GCM10009560_74730 [Nonomuraea longicatena]|uniref:Uncharacterized protein n=1 Tax=Nonomuraea longicatena TaxID=83682 RepID=A0ABP4BQT4_9ACTN
MSTLQKKACGLDPFTGHETAECAPISTLSGILFLAWLFAPIGCSLLGSLISFIPRPMRRARLAALWLIPLWPLSVVVGAVLANELY